MLRLFVLMRKTAGEWREDRAPTEKERCSLITEKPAINSN